MLYFSLSHVSSWVLIMGIAAVYSIAIFTIQLVRYLIHKTPENELIDDSDEN